MWSSQHGNDSFSKFFISNWIELCWLKVNTQRLSKLKLEKSIPSVIFEFPIPSSGEAIDEASNGLADLEEHYGLDAMALVKVDIAWCYWISTHH